MKEDVRLSNESVILFDNSVECLRAGNFFLVVLRYLMIVIHSQIVKNAWEALEEESSFKCGERMPLAVASGVYGEPMSIVLTLGVRIRTIYPFDGKVGQGNVGNVARACR